MSNAPVLELNKKNLKKIATREQRFGDEFVIAVLSDTHNYYTQLVEAIQKINSRKSKIAFVVITGDITNLGLLSEYETVKDLLKNLEVPFLVAIGNHDYLVNGKKIFRKIFGSSNMSFSFKDTRLIIIDNNNWESESRAPDLTWMDKKLKNSGEKTNIIFSHIPPGDHDRFSQKMINKVNEILMAYSVDYYLSGHNHNPREGILGQTKHVTIGSVSKNIYIELKISPTEVTHEKIHF